jgi:hypothetical protein
MSHPKPREITLSDLTELLEKAERGELKNIAVRFVDDKGQLHEHTAGFDSEAEAEAALTALREAQGDLH